MVDDAELARWRAEGALAETRITPPPAVGSPAARRSPAAHPFASAGAAGGAAGPSAGTPLPRRAAEPAPAPVASDFELVISSGERFRVAGRGVIGRDPDEAAGSYAHRITLADTEKLLSRAHLEFGLESNGSFWVSDLNSTNGVVVERVGQAPQRCLPGFRVVIQPGERVDFGGRTLTIERR